jgi:FKBP-type peptidyl-prolyl cis-trans isomerase
MKPNWLINLVFLLFIACNNNKESNAEFAKPQPSYKKTKEPFKRINKYLSHKENELIEAYIARYNYPMKSTGTGVRYYIYKENKGKKVTSGKYVTVSFNISLLNGQRCYSSKEKGPETFLVDQDNVESGLHEAIKLLHVGEKAIIILPPHKAHGLIGDSDKIPPLTTVVYDIEVLAVKDSP